MLQKLPAKKRWAALVELSMDEMRVKTDANKAWGLGTFKRWESDSLSGTISFLWEDGSIATAAFQVIGSYSTEEGTWLWSWANAYIPVPLTREAELAKAYGEKEGLERLTTRKFPCTEYEAWEITAVACHLAGSPGVYRAPSGPLRAFLTFGEVSFQRVS